MYTLRGGEALRIPAAAHVRHSADSGDGENRGRDDAGQNEEAFPRTVPAARGHEEPGQYAGRQAAAVSQIVYVRFEQAVGHVNRRDEKEVGEVDFLRSRRESSAEAQRNRDRRAQQAEHCA